MKKLYALLVLLIMGSTFTWGTDYTVTVYQDENKVCWPAVNPSGGVVESFGLATTDANKLTHRAAAIANPGEKFPDGTPASTFGDQSIEISYPNVNFNNANYVEIGFSLTSNAYAVTIYFTAPESVENPELNFRAGSGNISNITYIKGGSYGNQVAWIAKVYNSISGDCYIRTDGFSGGFAGMTFTDNLNGGTFEDLFSTRVISNNRKRSEWTYGGYARTTHGLTGGVDDNDILYISNDSIKAKGADNANGNISFTFKNETTPYLSVTYKSYVYIPVPTSDCTGTITMTSVQNTTENVKNRCLINIKGDKSLTMERLDGSSSDDEETYSSFSFDGNDITDTRLDGTPVDTKGGYYIRLKHKEYNDVDVEGGKSKDGYELKIKSFKIELTSNVYYDLPKPTEDYDHSIGGDHSHAIFNYSEGDLGGTMDSDKKYINAWIKLTKGAAKDASFTGSKSSFDIDSNEKKSELGNTSVLQSFRSGDLVKYKDQYYGALQLIRRDETTPKVTYTFIAPSGYYITTSVKLHGYRNIDSTYSPDKTSDSPDKRDEKLSRVELAYLNGGEFTYDGQGTDSSFDFFRDDKNARTTTLDFEVPASEEVPFNLGGYQLLGVVDAVLVRKEAVPSETSHMYYSISNNTNENEVDLTYNATDKRIRYKHEKDSRAGTLEYRNNETVTVRYPRIYDNEVLYWYFESDGDNFDRKGLVSMTMTSNTTNNGMPFEITDGDYDTASGEGVKDDNVTKTFYVRNYRFVTAAGNHTTDKNHLSELYGLTSAGTAKTLADRDAAPVKPLEDDGTHTGNTPLNLTITRPGTLYYYSKNTQTNLNGPLVQTTFTYSNTSGVEDVLVEDEMTQDDENAPIYNVYGQRVDSNYRGIVIKNGRKYYQK